MKNERVFELFSANIDRLYAAAKEKHGARAEEALVNAVRKTAGKFKKLGEKAYITVLLQELGVGAFYQAEESAPYGLAEKLAGVFAERYAAAQKKSRLFAILGGAAAAVCLAVVVGLLLRPGDTIVTDGATIKGAKAYTSGDFVLTNVHTINDYIGFDGDFEIRFSGEAGKELAATTVAPDGTVYLLTVCEAKPEQKINMLGLFKMTEEGWVEVCRFEKKIKVREFVINNNGDKLTVSSFSRGFVFCDAESTPIVFLHDYENGNLTAYSCDVQTGKTEAVAEVPVTVSEENRANVDICACADGDRIYFVACDIESYDDHNIGAESYSLTTLVYDLQNREFRKGSEQLIVDNNSFFLNAVVHRGDCTYLLGADNSGMLTLYGIKNAAEDTQELVYKQQLYMGYFPKQGYNCASLYVDDAGTAYVFATYQEDEWVPSSTRHGLEIVSAEGEILCSKSYAPLNNNEEAMNCAIFMGPDETLYFIEFYEFERKITVGAIAEDYEEISEAATFKSGIADSYMLPVQFISDPAGKNGVFVDLLGKTEVNDSPVYRPSVMRFGYMRLQLK